LVGAPALGLASAERCAQARSTSDSPRTTRAKLAVLCALRISRPAATRWKLYAARRERRTGSQCALGNALALLTLLTRRLTASVRQPQWICCTQSRGTRPLRARNRLVDRVVPGRRQRRPPRSSRRSCSPSTSLRPARSSVRADRRWPWRAWWRVGKATYHSNRCAHIARSAGDEPPSAPGQAFCAASAAGRHRGVNGTCACQMPPPYSGCMPAVLSQAR
jgi:hypothetical protein